MKGCDTIGISEAWEDHAQEIHLKGTTLSCGLCESGA